MPEFHRSLSRAFSGGDVMVRVARELLAEKIQEWQERGYPADREELAETFFSVMVPKVMEAQARVDGVDLHALQDEKTTRGLRRVQALVGEAKRRFVEDNEDFSSLSLWLVGEIEKVKQEEIGG